MAARRAPEVILLAGVLVLASAGHAQWLTQAIALRPGWNAVFLEVEPEDNACTAVFAGVPVQSVWAWNRRFEPVRYIQDADSLEAAQPEWLTYYPPGMGPPAATDLHAVQGGRAYLVKLGGLQGAVLNVRGKPVLRSPTWVPGSFNLVGFPLAAQGAPTIATFFAPSTAHQDPRLHRLSATGKWERVASPAASALRAGEAVWAYCATASDYEAPLSLRFGLGGGLDFGRALGEITLQLRNHTTAEKTVTLRLAPSEAPPTETGPFVAGPVPLSCYRVAPGQIGWGPLDEGQTVTVPAGSEVPVRLAVRRAAMASFTPPAGVTSRSGVIYASLLEVSDGEGVAFRVPVSSEGLVAYTKSADGRLKGDDPRVGLWVGYASLDYVSSPAQTAPEPEPPAGREHAPNIPAGGEFEFRLIVHVDESLQARLVQQVTLMFDPGAYGPAPGNPTRQVVVEAGRSVLITDDALLGQYSGTALRDGQEVGRRLSTAAYAFPRSGGTRPSVLDLAGDFSTASTAFPEELTCTFTLAHDDPLNPFLHRYHPDHDNLDDQFAAPKQEALEVQRTITLVFSDSDPERPDNPPSWWDSEVGGWYEETVAGVHKADLRVEGVFRLERVSRVGTLNGGARR